MHTHGKPSPRTAIVLAPTDAAQLSAAASVLALVGQDGDRYQRSRNVAHTTASPRTTIIRGTGEAGSGRYQPAPPPPPPLPSPPTLSSIHTILERQPLPRPQTITVGVSFANVSARDSKVSDFSHGFSRIGIDNQAPMLFEVDQRHLLQLVKDFNDSLLDGDFLLLRTIQNPSGTGASPQRSSSDRGAAAVNSTALYRQGGASFLMQASAELARANMIRQASEGRVTPGSASTSDMPSGSGPPGGLGQLQHVASPLTERYLPSEVHEQLCGLPPAAAVSMRFRLSPWRSLFEKWIAGLLEERRPEAKHLAGRAVSMSTGGGVSSSRKPTTTTTASSDLAWESVRPTRVHSKNVDPVLQLELLIQCAFRVADLHALSEEVPSAGQPVAALLAMPSPRGALPQSLASSQAISRSMGPSSYVTYGAGGGGGTAKRHESFSFAGTPRQQAAQQKAQVYDRMVKPPKGVPHLICTATALFALVENLQEMFGPGCAPLMREVLRVLMPLILNAPAVRASAPDMLLAQPLSQKQQRGSGGQSDGTLEDRNAGGGFHGHPADYAIRYVHCTIAHDVTQQLALRRVGAYRMRDKVVLRQHQDRTIFSSIKAVMRPFLQSLFQQWRAITRRHRALKTAIGSLLVLSSDREVTRRCVQRWLFTSRTVHYGVNIAQDMRHEDDLSPSNAMLQRLAMAAMENALTLSMSSPIVSGVGAGAFPPPGASIPSSLPPYVPAALISPRGSLLVRDSNEVSLDRNVGAPPIAIGRRLSAVVVEDSELEPPAAPVKPLKSPRGTTTSVGALLPIARRVSTVFVNDETPGVTTPQVPPPLAVFRIAPSSPPLPGLPGALPGTGSSESTSGRGGRLDGSTLALSTSAAVSPASGRDNPMLAPTMKQHPIQFPFSPLIHGVARMSTENMFSPMVSPRFTAMGGRASLTSAQQQQMFNSTNPDSVLSGSVRDGNLSCDPMSFNTSNPAHLAAFNVSNPAGMSLKLMGSLRSPKRGSVSIPGHRFNTSMQGGSNAASPSHSMSTVQGSVFDPKKPSERHRRLAMIVNGLQRSVEHRNNMIAEFEYTHRAAMEERTEQLDEMVETYTKASERIGASFRSVMDYMYPLVPSPLMGNAMMLQDLGSGSLSYNKDGSLNLLSGPDGVAQDLSFPPHQRTGGSIAAPAGDKDESFLFPGQVIPPIDMRPLAEAGSEAKKSQQRVREAETAHLYGQPRKKQSTDTTESGLPSKLNKNTRNPTPSSMMVDRNFSSPSAVKRNHTITLQEAEGELDREMFRRQERIFNWLMHLAKHDVGSAGARLGTFLNRCCSDRTANLTLSVVGRTSHLLPLVRLALMSLAPPSLTHFQLVDLFSEELLTKASVVAAAPPPPASKTNEYPLSLKLGRQSQEGSQSVRSAGAVTLPPSDPSETSSPTFATFEPPQQLGPLTQHDSPRHSVGDIAFSFLRKQSASGGGALGIVGSQSNLTGSSSGPNTRRGSQRRRSSVGFMLDTPRPEALMPELREESETQKRRQSEQRRGSTFGGSAGGANGGGSGAGGRRRTINPTVGFRAFDSEGAPVANGGGSAGGSNNASPFAASLLMADSAIHTEDLNTAARRVSVAMEAFQQHHNSNHGSLSVVVKSTRSRSLATKLDIVTLRAAQLEESNVHETFSQQYRRMSQHPSAPTPATTAGQQQQGKAGSSNRPTPSTSKNVTPATATLTPAAGALHPPGSSKQSDISQPQQQQHQPITQTTMLDVANMNQVLRRKSVDLYQHRAMTSIANLEAAALSMVKEHRKGFFHPGIPDPLLPSAKRQNGDDEDADLTQAISFSALGATDEEREEEMRLREEDALLREEEQQLSAISEEVERAIREKEIQQILTGVGNCSDATSFTHLVIKLMNRLYVHHHQAVTVEDLTKGPNAPDLDQTRILGRSASKKILDRKKKDPGAASTHTEDIYADSTLMHMMKRSPHHLNTHQTTLIRVFPQILTRHLVLKHKNWRHLVMAALYFTQVGPTCLAFRNVYSGLENRARKPLKSLSPQDRRDVLLGKAPRVSYLVAASVIPEHDPPPKTPQQMHQLFATRKQRKRDQHLEIEEANATTMYHDAIRDVSLKAFYGIGLTTTAGQLYDQFCAASPDIADATIILPSFLATKMKIVFGHESSFWRPVTSMRAIHSSSELEEILTTLAPLGRISPQDLCDRLLNSLDDTDLFYVAMASQEVEDAYTACFPEVSVVFSLYATASYAGAVVDDGNPNAPPPTPKVSYDAWMTMNQAMYDVNYSSVVAEMIFHTIARRVYNQEAQDAALAQGTTSAFQLQQVLMLAGSGGVLGTGGGGGHHGPALDDNLPLNSHKASVLQQEDIARRTLERVSLDLDGFCDALSVMASMKFPSPFTPLEQKVTPFVQTLLVPLAGSKSKDIRRKMHVQAGSGIGGVMTKGDLRGAKALTLDNLSPELRAKIGMIREKQKNDNRRQQRLPE